jgi:hypothetical protein
MRPVSKGIKENVRMKVVDQDLGRPAACALAALAVALLAVCALCTAPQARADFDEWGIESVEASLSTLEAGRHPDVITSIGFDKPVTGPSGDLENLWVELPQGLVANPQGFPPCPFITFVESVHMSQFCSPESQVGLVEVKLKNNPTILKEPLYNLESPNDEIARLGFLALFYPIYLEVDLRSQSDYGVTVKSLGAASAIQIESIRTKTWGVPADHSHDTERITPLESLACPGGEPCLVGGSRASTLPPVPFMSNPSSCEPMNFRFTATSYQLPGQTFTASADAGVITDCDKVPFEPFFAMTATSHRAGAPTGLEATLRIPPNEQTNTANTSSIRGARVQLPEGFVVNSSAVDGLQACDVAQAGFSTAQPAACPDQSKLGDLEITSPGLKRPIEGGIYLRTPEPGHLFRFWLVSNELGVNLKLPAEVALDEKTGRLTTVIHESPQLPAEKVVLRFNGGARAPLRNPSSCGVFDASYELSPWSGNPPVRGSIPLAVNEGCDAKFNPQLVAGATNPVAGRYSPFVFDLIRLDGEQNMSSVDVSLPRGLTAKLAGVAVCPDPGATLGTCPAASKIGEVKVTVGAGNSPLSVPQIGKDPTAVFLAGPYKGGPYSVVAVVPAQAGPFDLGLVAVRSAIYIDPVTTQVTVKSDEFPQFLQGVPVDYRHVRVEVSRDRFTLNPTSCAQKAAAASLRSVAGATATPSDRFEVTNCASLPFKPGLSLRLRGGTARTANPRLHAVFKARPGQANLRYISVALPHSEFLDQAHIQTVCTRVQFAANRCPKGSIYGRAKATTPLLDRPLSGPIYLRSSSHELPDLVVDLEGQIHVSLVGRIDTVNGGIRTTFEAAPDAPIKKFILDMKGGRKGLLVNSRNLCGASSLVHILMKAHNGMQRAVAPMLANSC